MRLAITALLLLIAGALVTVATGGPSIIGPAPISDDKFNEIIDSSRVISDSTTAAYGAAYKTPYSEAISSQAGVSGDYFAFGYHEFGAIPWPMSTTASVTLGAAGDVGGAHAIIIADSTSGAGPDTVQIIGNRVFDAFNTASVLDTAFVYIAASDSSGQFYETTEKWSGEVTFNRFDVAAGARNVNYGLISYFDNMNTDFVLTDFRIRGVVGANDTGFKLWLRKAQNVGWGFDDTGVFSPGFFPAPIIKLADVQPTDDDLVSGRKFTWKQTGIDEAITGSGDEGFYVHILTAVNNALESGTATFFYQTPQ